MKYRDKPALQDRLAAEYVLGTLRGRARQRFQAWLREDAALQRAVGEWEARLAPMVAAVPELQPPRRVWRVIQARIAGTMAAPVAAPVTAAPAVGATAVAAGSGAASAAPPSPAKPAAAAPPDVPAAPPPAGSTRARTSARASGGGFWENLAFWRGWGLVATGCAAALVAAIALRAPQVVEVPVVKEIESTRMQPSYVAILRDDAGRAVFVAYAGRRSDELWVKRIGLEPEPPEHGYELWGLLAKEGAPPQLLGMLPRDDKATIRLAGAADQVLRDFPALAITLEPAKGSGGSPTGPLVAKGDCFKFW